MPIETDDDRAVFLDLEAFGVAVVWTRNGVAQTPFNAIFNRPTQMVDGLASVTVIDRDAFLCCSEASLPVGADAGDPVAVDGEDVAFACKAIRPDGTGMCVVDLKRA